jgi:hypothetical protein
MPQNKTPGSRSSNDGGGGGGGHSYTPPFSGVEMDNKVQYEGALQGKVPR